MLELLFSSNIPLYTGKKTVEKLCKVLEMELKTYKPVDVKFVFHYIHNISSSQIITIIIICENKKL